VLATSASRLEEAAALRAAADAVNVPYDPNLRVHQQSAGFSRLPPWDFEASRDPLRLQRQGDKQRKGHNGDNRCQGREPGSPEDRNRQDRK
jgi:hypothetical protein